MAYINAEAIKKLKSIKVTDMYDKTLKTFLQSCRTKSLAKHKKPGFEPLTSWLSHEP